jgi:hypothetical protein
MHSVEINNSGTFVFRQVVNVIAAKLPIGYPWTVVDATNIVSFRT